MSRWTDQFLNHPFWPHWQKIKTLAAQAKVDDIAVSTSVLELGRFKKIVAYVDEILGSLDPELVPLGTWDNFASQAAPCVAQLERYEANRNIAHVQSANEHADNLLTYVRPYLIAKGRAGRALQESAKAYALSLDEHVSSFESTVARVRESVESDKLTIQQIREEIVASKASIDEVEEELTGSGEVADGTFHQIKAKFEEFEEKYDEIVGFYNETLVGVGDQPSTRKSIQDASEAAAVAKKKVEVLTAGAKEVVEELDAFYEKLFGAEDGEGVRSGGLGAELDIQRSRLNQLESDQKIRNAALTIQIESLLPGATSAGLASAYKEMKDSFETPVRIANRVFYGAITLLVVVSAAWALTYSDGELTFVVAKNWDSVLRGLAIKAPLYGPIIWLAYYATKRRSEYQRLQQEYAHKEALAKSYDSYKKQIEELDATDIAMQKSLMTKAIDAIAYNASESLDGTHGDKMPLHEIVEQVVAKILESKALADSLKP